jgi:Leucine-rich repeat (LRR) protein
MKYLKLFEDFSLNENRQDDFENFLELIDSGIDENLEIAKYLYDGQNFEKMFIEKFGKLKQYSDLLNCHVVELLNMEKIDLRHCKLKKFPIELASIKGLKELNLQFNEISKIPVEIGNFKNLQTLNLSNNKFTKIPKELSLLENIEYLNIENNNAKVDFEIFGIKTLRHLNLDGVNLVEIPKSIIYLKMLRTLSLCNCKLTEIPKYLFDLPSLKNVYMRQNYIKSIPTEINNSNLESLYLYQNPVAKDVGKKQHHSVRM